MDSCSSSLLPEIEQSTIAEEELLPTKPADIQTLSSSMENDSTDRFFQRVRTDLMYELRNIQHGEKPVTGTNYREQLEQFMEKHVVGLSDNSAAGSSDGKNIHANVATVENHRPKAVVVEVQAMVELRPVSSLLQSGAFRRHLENVIRGSLTNRVPARSTFTNSRIAQPTPVVEAASSSGLRSSPITTATIQTSSERLPLRRQYSNESVESFSSARSSFESDIESDNEEIEESATPLTRTADLSSSRPVLSPEATISSTLERGNDEQNQSPNVGNLWNDITRAQREEIVDEISGLLHSRLVSSTLEGEFRTVLELLAQNHLSSSGTNGRAVEEFINTLPRTGVQRNDFSQLGIPAVQENENWDNVSVMSVSAHSVPYTQTNTYLGREIQSLKSQMNEMKSMIKLTFDLQMDIQRAIRQEVAAAMNNCAGQGATGSSIVASKPPCPISDTHCLICLERHTDTVLYQCGHMCVCFVCGRDLMVRGHNCPVCRAPIKDVIRAYKTNAE